MISEPAPTQGDLRFSIAGIPVRVHPLFWLVMMLLGLNFTEGKTTPVLIWLVAAFLSILLHELGHALTARAYGWAPRIVLHGMGGVAIYRPTRHRPLAQILITLAGPVAGFVFAGLVLLTLKATGHDVYWVGRVVPWVFPFDPPGMYLLATYLIAANILWGLLNLLPVFPLDGGQIAREVLNLLSPGDGLRFSIWISILTAVGMGVFAFVKLGSPYTAMFFAYLAYVNFMAWQTLFGRGGWS